MSIRVKRIIALSVCALLLVVAVVQNVRSGKEEAGELQPTAQANGEPIPAPNQQEEFFAQARLERESQRAAAEAECATIIADGESTQDEIAQATETSQYLSVMTETEKQLESVIAGRGYEDVLVLLTNEGDVEITVSKTEINADEASAIATIAREATGVSLDALCVKCYSGVE